MPFGYLYKRRLVRKIKARREIDRLLKLYNPDEPRDERGRWTSGGGGADAPAGQRGADPGQRDTVEAWKANQPMHSSADHLAASADNQAGLSRVAGAVANETGTRFVNPGAKSKESLDRKIGTGRAPNTITDAVRGGFLVQEPGDADKVITGLRAKGLNLIDEGWRTTRLGYFDRTALVRFSNGQVGEIQFWHGNMLAAKNLVGHTVYEEARKLPDGSPRALQLMAQSRAIYESVSLPASWNAVRGKAGS